MARGSNYFSRSFKLSVKFKAEFENTQRILDRMGQVAKRAIMGQGGYIRKTAVNSIKTIDGPSAPGSPPHNHRTFHGKRGALKNLLFFKWDDSSSSLVVGPELLPSMPTAPTIPEILESGGTEMATVKSGMVWQNKQITIAPRPYMSPALQSSQQRLPEFWAKSLIT